MSEIRQVHSLAFQLKEQHQPIVTFVGTEQGCSAGAAIRDIDFNIFQDKAFVAWKAVTTPQKINFYRYAEKNLTKTNATDWAKLYSFVCGFL